MIQNNTTWREEVIWAAGYFDGEGSTGAYKQTSPPYRNRLRLSIGSTFRPTLIRFKNAVKVGNVNGPYYRDDKYWKPTYIYACTTWRDCQTVIVMLAQFLSEEKYLQAVKALQEATWSPSRRAKHGESIWLYNQGCRCLPCVTIGQEYRAAHPRRLRR
jgi:hypothetical protein